MVWHCQSTEEAHVYSGGNTEFEKCVYGGIQTNTRTKFTATRFLGCSLEMWSIWTRNFKSALDTVAPVKKRGLRRHSCPLLTPELLNLIHEWKRFYRLLRKPGAYPTTLFPAYRSLRRDANNLYRQLRNSYYQKCCQEYYKIRSNFGMSSDLYLVVVNQDCAYLPLQIL